MYSAKPTNSYFVTYALFNCISPNPNINHRGPPPIFPRAATYFYLLDVFMAILSRVVRATYFCKTIIRELHGISGTQILATYEFPKVSENLFKTNFKCIFDLMAQTAAVAGLRNHNPSALLYTSRRLYTCAARVCQPRCLYTSRRLHLF